MKLNSLGCPVPWQLYTAQQVRDLDALAIAETEGGGYALMHRAGQAAFDLLRLRFPSCQRVTVVCGGGNNGGDGYVLAELALQAGLSIQVLAVTDPTKLTGEAQQAYQHSIRAGVTVLPWSTDAGLDGEVIVDALLGTGLSGAVRSDYAEVIEWINQAGLPVLAIDIPSGLAADTGMPLGPTVVAQATITFIGIKQGLLTGKAADFVGELWFDDLQVSAGVYAKVSGRAERIDLARCWKHLPARKASAHKGSFGHVLVIGGEHGFGGAPILAAEAALYAGAGLVSCATRSPHVLAGLARRPDIMFRDAEQRSVLLEMIARADVIVIGPGLGLLPWGQMCFIAAVESGLPLVVDADGLSLLANLRGKEGRFYVLPPQSVLTPHPGEAARLLLCEVAAINRDRFSAVLELSEKYGCTVLLKGLGTLISGPDDLQSGAVEIQGSSKVVGWPVSVLCGHGNPGMAKAGMGDVLSGVIGALLAQGLNSHSAAQLGACWHAATADQLALNRHETGLSAGELPRLLAEVKL